ncbi:glycosyltransferase family 2 protein [Oceanibacterium hippocampi]|uniref:Glycosyl transferase family 2 n=1 Tax=Oceanibacterium hippocampi TaxID=745714 RepID=A0A1Y5TWH0_9PROT|nr:glycosyltransferase family 2 protein [Oceanibacterium hippocampi]SLN70065.1 Glycosyl transferase family 2 [Oceanibacterium hippocampi]
MSDGTGGGDGAPKLSGLVVARNEEARIADCLASLAFCDEIVVVLDRCTDRTREIAEAAGARIVAGEWPLEGDRRNAGIAACEGDWILELDADERPTPALAAEIRAAIANAPPGFFNIPFDHYIGTTLVRHGWGGYWGVRTRRVLFARGCKSWGAGRVHPATRVSGVEGHLQNPIAHYVDRDISDMLRRLDSYTTAHARDLRESGDIGTFGHNVRRIFSRFFKCYVSRKGYREGPYGFLIALMAGLYPILSYLKARLETD